MSEQPERPETLRPRRRPVPPADESVDPVNPVSAQPQGEPTAPGAPAVSVPAPAPNQALTSTENWSVPVPRRTATVQLGVRVAEDVAQLVSYHAAMRGMSQRAIVEEALVAHLSPKQG